MKWMPIKTAPKDGTHVLLLDDGWFCIAGYWDQSERGEGGQIWKDSQQHEMRFPKYWMPLPKAPTDDILYRLRHPIGTSCSDFNATYWMGISNEAANEIEKLREACLTAVLMLSEMHLDPREKCEMAYNYLSEIIDKNKENQCD